MPREVTIRTTLRPGDVETIVRMHGEIYAREYGFDDAFAAYVAEPLGALARGATARERIWLAERDGSVVGCVAIVTAEPRVAQLRWFLVHPSARGAGLGRELLEGAIAFARERGYASIGLWTVSALAAAAHLYRSVGFRKVMERPDRSWGVDVVEEKYELTLT
jgi:GNAT superfamily N-acetyltransferase